MGVVVSGMTLSIANLISHRFRGFGKLENTIESLLGALDFGVRKVEFDVRMAKCGTPMVYHDEHAMGAEGQRKLCEVMASDYEAVGGRFAAMPTLDDLLGAAAAHGSHALLLVDIKDAGFEEVVISLIHAHGLAERVVYVSWLPEVLYAVRELRADARLCLSHWASSPSLAARAVHEVFVSRDGEVPCPGRTVLGERSGWWLQKPLTGELADMVEMVCIPVADVTDALLAHYRARGIAVTAFSYVEIEAAEAAFARGVDPLFIDAKRVFEAV